MDRETRRAAIRRVQALSSARSGIGHSWRWRIITPFMVLLLLVAGLPTFTPPAGAVSPNIVISQAYGGAGCGTAGCSTYKNDYIELFNRGTTSVSVNGWSVQYAAATG